jgi:hypothetical protein
VVRRGINAKMRGDFSLRTTVNLSEKTPEEVLA